MRSERMRGPSNTFLLAGLKRSEKPGGPEPPHTEARLHGWLFIVNIALNTLRTSPETHARRVPPQAPFSVTYRNNKKAVEYKPVRA